ncbi:Uncharacterised protein [Acinetobacter baumannii]|nr:Uncharacterised protein [Acinetobacter baumannii]
MATKPASAATPAIAASSRPPARAARPSASRPVCSHSSRSRTKATRSVGPPMKVSWLPVLTCAPQTILLCRRAAGLPLMYTVALPSAISTGNGHSGWFSGRPLQVAETSSPARIALRLFT